MTELLQKIKALETKYKNELKLEKTKLMAKYRATQKKQDEAKEKLFLTKLNRLRKQINNDDILLGGLVRTFELIKLEDPTKVNQLIDLSKTLADS